MAAKSNPDKRVAKTSAKTTRRKAGVKSLTRRAPAKAAKAVQPGGSAGTTIERTVTIGRRPAELFDYWRDFSNLPRFMKNLDSVQVLSARKSHWVARGPGGVKAEWDAEITAEKPGEMIQWRSTSGSFANSGVVYFSPAPADGGSYVKVVATYAAPPGRFGGALSRLGRLVGHDPDSIVREALREFKRIMESDELPSTDGRASGRR